jgi:phage-related minor tail protein
LTGTLDREVALDNAKIDLAELEAAAAKAFGTGAQADIDDYEAKLATYAGVLAGISGTMDGISSKEILFKFKTQGSAAALEYATYLARGAEYGGLSPEDALGLAGISTLPRRAMGGPVAGGSTYLVGERGPELFTPGTSGSITPNNALGGGANITVNVNGGDPNQVVAAIQRWVRNNGSLQVATTSSVRF